MRNITETLMKPLEKFRKEQLGALRVMYDSLLVFFPSKEVNLLVYPSNYNVDACTVMHTQST